MRFLSVFLLLAGCEAKSSCTPGASAACACVDGTMGAQTCNAGGAFDSCVCAGDLPSGDNIQPTIVHDLGMPASGGGAKRVFVTGTAYVSDSLATACRDAATAAGLGGTWTA